MAIPLFHPLVWAAILAGSLILGMLITALALNVFRGKKLAILGERGVGKTTLFTYLSTESLPKKYRQNTGTEKVGGNNIKIDDLEFKMEESPDVSGGIDARLEWKKAVLDADIVFYMFRADLFKKRDEPTLKRAYDDIKHIAHWIKRSDKSKEIKLYLIGSHCDIDPEYKQFNNYMGDYKDNFKSSQSYINIKRIANFGGGCELVLGSMKNKKSTSYLVYDLLRRVDSNSK